MFYTDPNFLQSEMDYRFEKAKRGEVVRRRRRKALVRRQSHQSRIIN